MSSLSSEVLAARLLPLASDSAVVDFLLEKANYEHVSEPPSAFAGVWSAAPAKRSIKGHLARACAVAAHPSTDPQVLADFAKDSRVSVRHALLGNASTPYETVRALAPWALERKDSLALELVISRLRPADIVELLGMLSESDRAGLNQYRSDFLPTARIASKCLTSRETALRAAKLSWYSLAESMARFLVRRTSAEVSLTELVEAFPEKFRGDVVAAVFSRVSALTCEVANLARRFPPTHGYRVELLSEVVLIEPGALEIIAELGVHNLSFALANGLPESSVTALLDGASAQYLEVVVDAMSQRQFSSATERKIAKRLIAIGGDLHKAAGKGSLWPSPPAMVGGFVRYARHALPKALLLELLRHGSAASTRMWLSCPAGVPNGTSRLGVLTSLVASPHHAFSHFGRAQGAGSRGYDAALVTAESPQQWVLDAFSRRGSFLGNLSRDARTEIARVVDELLPAQLHSPAVAALAMPILEDTFGSNAQQWETFLTLASDWSGGFADLVEATCALSGIKGLTPAVPTPKAVPCEPLVLA